MKGHAQICYLSWDFEELWITIWAFFLFQNNFYYFKEIFFSYLKLNAHILGQRGRSSRVQSKYKRKVLPHHNGLFNRSKMAPALNLDIGGSHQGFLESLKGQSDTNHTKKLYRHCQKASKILWASGSNKTLIFS